MRGLVQSTWGNLGVDEQYRAPAQQMSPVIPVIAGIQCSPTASRIPAAAGMTFGRRLLRSRNPQSPSGPRCTPTATTWSEPSSSTPSRAGR